MSRTNIDVVVTLVEYMKLHALEFSKLKIIFALAKVECEYCRIHDSCVCVCVCVCTNL